MQGLGIFKFLILFVHDVFVINYYQFVKIQENLFYEYFNNLLNTFLLENNNIESNNFEWNKILII